MCDWLLTRRDFLKSSGLMFLMPWTRKPKKSRHPNGLLLLL
jgi:hypothetical protein